MTRVVVLKAVAVVCIACVILAIVLAHGSPAAGYELSIYASTPSAVLWLLFLSIAGGIGIVVHELFTSRYREGRTYLIGFAVILLGAIAFLCLPFTRDYVTSTRGDLLGHVGFVVDIVRTGHIGGLNPYPVTHSLLAQIATTTGLSALQVVNLNTVFVLPVFTLMAYLVATAILPNRGQQVLVALVAGGTMAGIGRYYLVPNTWSILMLPLLFYCYFKKDRIPFKILLAAILVVYPFFHPLSSLVVILALAVMELPKPIYSRLLSRMGMGVPSWLGSRPIVWPILLEAAVFFPWILSREEFRRNVYSFLEQLATFTGPHGIQEAGADLAKANVSGFGIAILMMKMYGELLVFLVLATLAAILLVKQLRSGIRDSGKYRLLLLGVLILLAVLFWAADFVGVPGARVFAADRMVVYAEIACIPLVAFALWEIATETRLNRLAKVGTYGMILLALLLNFLGHYSSPFLIRPNEQVTNRDMAGMIWYLEGKDPLVPGFYVKTPPERFSQGITGMEASEERGDMPYFSELETHFGYDNFTTIGEQYDGDRYINVNRYDRVVYQTVWRELASFNDADFRRLEHDPTVDRIYSNDEMDVLFVSQKSWP